jgi:hypothetical protein
MFLQQVHYWISRPEAHERDGRRWVYNSYPQWHEQFPFWGINTIRRTIETLEKHGLLLTGNYNTSAIDRTKWYSIDYDAVDALGNPPSVEKHRPSAQNGQTNISRWADDVPDMGRPIPETNTETNNRERAPAPATGDISPQPPSSNGHTSKADRVLAEETRPPAVTLNVPPRRPGQALQPGEPGTPPVQQRLRKAPIPEGWIPDTKYAARAVQEYPQLSDAQRAEALHQFQHHYEANQEPYANWGAKYLEWLHHEVHTYARAPGKGGPAPASDPPPPPTYHKPDPYGGRR